MGGETPEGEAMVDWLTAALRLVHPTKVIILEAMLWIGRPISATELEKMAGGMPGLSAFSFHLKQLSKAKVLEVVGKLKVKKSQSNKRETFFYFAGRGSDWMSQLPVLPDVNEPLANFALTRKLDSQAV
jgi:hypothetical protein